MYVYKQIYVLILFSRKTRNIDEKLILIFSPVNTRFEPKLLPELKIREQ